jgi:glycosyltransferase involved in cell wall biosynthesis
MRIGVCIPCHGNYIQYIEACLRCVKNQVRKPDLISISISGYNGEKLNVNIGIPVVLQTTSEKRCASENRNIAARNIYKRVDILSFFDVDDFMHPQKLQQVEKHFITTNADCFVHEFLEYPKEYYFKFKDTRFSWPEITGNLCEVNHELIKEAVCGRLIFHDTKNSNKILHTNGHLTCKTKVWEDIKWPEDFKNLGEDSEYNFRLFSKGYKYIVSTDKLSLYAI